MQRIKFRKQLGRFREKERDRKLMEDFGRRVISCMEASTLQPFTAKISIPTTMEKDGEGKIINAVAASIYIGVWTSN